MMDNPCAIYIEVGQRDAVCAGPVADDQVKWRKPLEPG